MLTIYENGTWRTNAAALSQGDELSIYVNAGALEYRHNGVTVYTSTYAGTPDFYVDTSFKSGAVAFTAVLAGIIESATPPPVAEPPPPTNDSGGGGGGGGGSIALPGLLVLLLLGCRGRRRFYLHNFAQP